MKKLLIFIIFFYQFCSFWAVADPSSFDQDSPTLELSLSKNQDRLVVLPKTIQENYTFQKSLSGGKSGSGIFVVSPKNESGERILKTLSPIKNPENIWKDIGFREIYFSKRLSELKTNKYLPPEIKASDFFPKFYGFGITIAQNPFKPEGKEQRIPFYIMEKLDGQSLADFALKPEEAKAMFSYSLKTAPISVIFSILFQITLALESAYEEFAFIHLDAHPGNIFLTSTPINYPINVDGQSIKLVGPKVKIIDFDQGEIEKIHPSPRQLYIYRPYLGQEFNVYKAENQNYLWPLTMAFKTYTASKNSDVRMVNFLIQTFKNRFQEAGLNVDGKYFNTLRDIIAFFAQNAYKFGLVQKNEASGS